MPDSIDELTARLRNTLNMNGSTSSTTTNSTLQNSNADLDQRIRRIIQEEFRSLNQNSLNDIPGDIAFDGSNLSDLDKIPDVVKTIREFAGDPATFTSWKKSVDRVLTIYDSLKGTPKYYGILSTIRNKIVGQADIALESYNTPLDWNFISKVLVVHYADKRDLGTLDYQMDCLVQGNQTISAFYQKVYEHLSLILNTLSNMGLHKDALAIMTQSYRQKALDTFIRGLNGNLPQLLSIREVTDLPQALHLCLKLDNINFRTQFANQSNYSHRQASRNGPQQNNNNGRKMNPNAKPFYPALAHIPNPLNPSYTPRLPAFPPQSTLPPPASPQQYNAAYQQQSNARFNPSPQAQNQQSKFPPPTPPRQPRPVPMEVDHSIHSRMVNYQNMNAPKRDNGSGQHQIPNKLQRTYFATPGLEQNVDIPLDQQYSMNENLTGHDSTYFNSYDETSVTDYYNNTRDIIEDSQLEITNDLQNLNFLD